MPEARQSALQEPAAPRKTKPGGAKRPAQGEDAVSDESGHVRTSTGYVREGGERVYRVSIMLTRDERRRLREQADDEGMSITDLVRRALSL